MGGATLPTGGGLEGTSAASGPFLFIWEQADRGARPSDLPVEQPTKFDFIVNRKTAQALGLTIPPSVLQQATEIIQ